MTEYELSLQREDEAALEELKQLRPQANPSAVAWGDLKKKLGLSRVFLQHRQHLLSALVQLVSGVAKTEREKTHGSDIDKVLQPYLRSSKQLADLLKDPPQEIRILLGSTLSMRDLPSSLFKFVDALEDAMAPREKGRPRLEHAEAFALKVQQIWRNITQEDEKLGAHYDPAENRVVGPVVDIAEELLRAGDLEDL